MEKIDIKTVRGLYQHPYIILDNGDKIEARCYGSKSIDWNNQYGFWNLKPMNDDYDWLIIFEFVKYNKEDD